MTIQELKPPIVVKELSPPRMERVLRPLNQYLQVRFTLQHSLILENGELVHHQRPQNEQHEERLPGAEAAVKDKPYS